jgi:membrane-associated protease RseP (regulator of RpoE activity)
VSIEGGRGFGKSMGVGDFMVIDADWTLVWITIIVWAIILRSWEKSGILDRWNSSRVFKVILMIRGKQGLKILEKISKPRRFWRAYGEVSLWLCSLALFAVTLVVILSFISALLSPPTIDPPSVSEMVAIPGLNPIIPLGWGIIAFVVSLVIHEFGHGLIARAHGMRVRSFGLLMLGPLPLGAFAEPQYQELMRAPRRERLRMFAAGPATNLFAAFILMIMMGMLASQVVAINDHIHVREIVKDSGADLGGMQPWDTLVSIDGQEIIGVEGFRETLGDYSSGERIDIVVRRESGLRETITVNLTDKHQYYSELGWSNESLVNIGVEVGDPFLGVMGMSEGTAGIDRLAGPFSPRWQGNTLETAISVPIHSLTIMLTPFQMNGVAIHPFEQSLLQAGDGMIASLIGLDGILLLVNLFFWLMWVNILLGFTNLIPMVPFDGGHMFRDFIHGSISAVKRVGKKLKLWNIHALKVDHFASKASSLSSMFFFIILIFIMVVPYF